VRSAPSTDAVRLDRWLWAARFYKTRSQAAEAIDGGKVQLNGVRAKRAAAVRRDDLVRIRRPPYEVTVVVRGLSGHRGPAVTARALYQETPESAEARERLRLQLRVQTTPRFEGKGRPTKRDRRALDRWREGG
jgi:ribosome-associated heat shock protein Hsp15